MHFSKQDSKTLNKIIVARRDVRGNHFCQKPIEKKVLKKILLSAQNAPSVGFSQPWRFIIIENDETKDKIHTIFTSSYEKSKKKFQERPLYKNLKLEGIKEAPINIAVLYKKPKKAVLGQTYMKKSGEYSVVCAIENMWLMARSLNVGMGWVSIVRPKKVKKALNISPEYKFIAYLCLGYTDEFLTAPELKTLGWGKRKKIKKCILK
ncbi:MAG: 5,6-dimethylbenzimidazole synthase [Candidatus Marinarcus sp.]|uniref:5,6-dimethylbenzimidazole synthase n=1 Tax=Candidatus Marinarcus sp. TaxID=3100987 RepID=UPI003AFFCA0C